jgi:heme-degrading monooxygenase HmoA
MMMSHAGITSNWMTIPSQKGNLRDMETGTVVIFRSRKSGIQLDAYNQTAAEMSQLVTTIPGYISHKTFHHADGETVTLGEFESLDAVHHWGNHPTHRAAQAMGQQTWYDCYELTICDIHSRKTFNRDKATP